jgi:nicotinamide mononucleotide transporter
MSDLFSVHRIAFTVLGYPLSYIELVGTSCYLWSVWLIARKRSLTWPVGLVSSVLYLALFYQIRLYADAFEQIYYLGAGVYGWWRWTAIPAGKDTHAIRFSPARQVAAWGAVTAAAAVGTGAFLSRVHIIWPLLFPEPAAFPYLDALTTVMSFTAMWLMAQKRTESWVYWIIVDVIGVGLYFVKEVRFVALLYVVLLLMAVYGAAMWMRPAAAPHA